MRISVIIVNWNTAGPLAQALQSLQPIVGLDWEPIVVDNASADESVAMLRRDFPAVTVIANPDNCGFGRACNQGFSRATGDYVLLLNPDAALLPGAVSTLVSYLETHPAVGMVGPTLLHDDGQIQYSACRNPSLKTEAYEWFGLRGLLPDNEAVGALYYGYRQDRSFACDWLVGACLLVRRETLAEVGGFDERFWLYAEELDWCRRMNTAGWQTHFVPAARVRHSGGAASAKAASPMLVEWFRSRHQYHAKYDPPWVRAGLAGLYIFALGLRVAVYRIWARLQPERGKGLSRDADIFAACLQFHLRQSPVAGPARRDPDPATVR
ncbi:MAG: glycosyltransferase family 2 protein [Candidatus Sericytochromatia bacterium]|nr:glycosyltransferase family 2 protein [Candidatus Sericytochromatia bacterium]